MNRRQNTKRLTLWLMALIGVLYFCALIPFNLTGADTPEMLEVFEVDEYAQYPHLIRMLTPGESLYGSVRNFFIYLHYYYGFPFYFWSAVSVFPVKLLGGAWPGDTRIIVCVLRQMISVLPMILSAWLLVRIMTGYKRVLFSLLLFVLLLSMPAVVRNDLWWHPDSLTLLFLCLTFYFLDRDGMRCGLNFYFAAAACGAAVGTKYLGLYFALAIPGYLICCRLRNRISTAQLFIKAGLFLAVMAAFILISDPLLLLPQERAEILGIMNRQRELSGTGIFLRYENSFFENGHLPAWLTENYMRLPWLILALCGLAAGLLIPERRVMTVVFGLYLVTACTVNLNTSASRLHYFLPILLPLSAQITNLREGIRGRYEKPAAVLFCLLLAVQIGINLKTDAELLKVHLHREENSGSISLYQTLAEEYLPLPEVPAERMTRVYRDWKAYFPEQNGYAVKTDWDLASFRLIEDWNPDLILLENENIRAYSAEDILDRAVDRDQMKLTADFYSAAAADAIPGYALLTENSFGKVFRKVQP